MNRAVLIILLHVMYIPVYSQYFTKEEGSVLLHELKSARNDSVKTDRLVKVAEYHTFASYDHPANFDTAAYSSARQKRCTPLVNWMLQAYRL